MGTRITTLAKVAEWVEDNDIPSYMHRPMIYANDVHDQLRSSHEFRDFFFDLKMGILCQ
jgi:hypothetical protein